MSTQTVVAKHMIRHIPGALESYVYKYYTRRSFWSLVAESGAVTIVDHDEDEDGEFCVIMFHDADIAAEFGVTIVDEDAAQDAR